MNDKVTTVELEAIAAKVAEVGLADKAVMGMMMVYVFEVAITALSHMVKVTKVGEGMHFAFLMILVLH